MVFTMSSLDYAVLLCKKVSDRSKNIEKRAESRQSYFRRQHIFHLLKSLKFITVPDVTIDFAYLFIRTMAFIWDDEAAQTARQFHRAAISEGSLLFGFLVNS